MKAGQRSVIELVDGYRAESSGAFGADRLRTNAKQCSTTPLARAEVGVVALA
jgi:hypothetical protein